MAYAVRNWVVGRVRNYVLARGTLSLKLMVGFRTKEMSIVLEEESIHNLRAVDSSRPISAAIRPVAGLAPAT